MRKEMKLIFKTLTAQGWSLDHGKKHVQAKAPDGKGLVTLSATPSDIRTLRNTKADLRRAGAVL